MPLAKYSPEVVVASEPTKGKLTIFNSVVAANRTLKEMSTHQLVKHVVKKPDLGSMFPNLVKLATIGLLLPMSTVDCERGFSALNRVICGTGYQTRSLITY